MKLLITFPELSLSKSSEADDSESLIRHDRYYFRQSEMAIFKVEGRLYKVHRHFFIRESEIFESMFSCPPDPYGGQDGCSDKKPIHLPEVTCAEFEALLDFFYYGMFNSKNPARGHHTASCSEREHAESSQKILNLLSISLRYAFDNIITDILVSIDTKGDCEIDPVSKILLALKHDVLKHWLLPTFQKLLVRPESLTKGEIQQLGASKAAIISNKREDGIRGGREDFFVAGVAANIVDEIPLEFFVDN